VQRELEAQGLKSKLLMQVHDELVLNVLTSELEIVRPLVISCMQDAVKLAVPLIVETGIGHTWLDAH